MEEIDPRYLLIKIVRILERLNIPYIITGGMAVFVWGRPRYTADIDTVIELQAEKGGELAEELMRLGKRGYVNAEAIHDALGSQGEFNFIDGTTGMKVDFWVSKNDEFAKSQFERKIGQDILGTTVYFTSPEDLVLAKLRWHKISSSDRHLEDVRSVFSISGDKLDMEYLDVWAKKLGVQDILDNLLSKK